MQSSERFVVVLGSGGTIAGTAASATDTTGYTAGTLGVDALVAAVPALGRVALQCEQVAQLDSKDMSHAVWRQLALRCAHHLARDDVAGVVLTHGTDTLEETAYFLHRVLAPAKPLVLTAAMRPATALSADGPQNLLDAVTLASEPGAAGVLVVLAGQAHGAADVRKQHTVHPTAFTSGDAGPVALLRDGRVRRLRDWPAGTPLGLAAIARAASAWPWVPVLANHAGAEGREVAALAAAGAAGFVVAGTGNGTLAAPLEAALVASGRPWVRCSRCAAGPVIADGRAEERSPWQARIDLVLALAA